MKEATIITLGRMACGTAILLTHMVTSANSTFVLLGVFLLGVPIEMVKRDQKEQKEEN